MDGYEMGKQVGFGVAAIMGPTISVFALFFPRKLKMIQSTLQSERVSTSVRIFAIVLGLSITAFALCCIMDEMHQSERRSPIYQGKVNIRPDVELAAKKLREQADIFKIQHTEDPLFNFGLYYNNGQLDKIISQLERCQVSVEKLKWLCKQIDTDKPQPERWENYQCIADELDSIASKLPEN